VKMRGQTKTKTVSGQHYAKSKLGENPWQNSERIRQRARSHEEFGDSKGIWSFPKQVARLVQELSSINGISKISVRKDGFDVFFVKKTQQTQQKILCSNHEFTERLDLLKEAFENEGLESNVLKTWTPPKDNACERKWKRFYRRLSDSMEEELAREKVRLFEESKTATSSVMSATVEGADDPLGKDDKKLHDEVKGCIEKANMPVEMQDFDMAVDTSSVMSATVEGADDPLGKDDEELRDEVKGCFEKASDMSVEKQDISDSFETPPLKCGMGETGALDEVDEPVIKCMEKEFDKALDDSAADSDDVDSEYAIHSRPSNVLKHDLRWTDENLKYLKGESVRWQKVLWIGDHMFVMNPQDGIVYIDPWGVPCDMEQSSLAAFEDLLRTS